MANQKIIPLFLAFMVLTCAKISSNSANVSAPISLRPHPASSSPSEPPVPAKVIPPSPERCAPAPASSAAQGIKGPYWPSWLAGTLAPSDIPTTYFTHLFHAFAGPNATSYQLVITPTDDQWMRNFTTIHEKSSVKLFLSIGGGDAALNILPNMASNRDNRAGFIQSTISTAGEYGFDGLDLDWDFPSNPEEMSNLALLLREWHIAVRTESFFSGRLLLSAAVYFSSNIFTSDVAHLDWV